MFSVFPSSIIIRERRENRDVAKNDQCSDFTMTFAWQENIMRLFLTIAKRITFFGLEVPNMVTLSMLGGWRVIGIPTVNRNHSGGEYGTNSDNG